MCYPKPGPRCSAHAKKTLDKALREYQEVTRDGMEMFRLKQGSPELQRITHIMENLERAQSDYDSTPEGQLELDRLISEVDRPHSEKRYKYELRKMKGQRARNLALRDFKKTQGEEIESFEPNASHSAVISDSRPDKWYAQDGASGNRVEELWGHSEGQPAFYAKVHYYADDQRLVLCDIERNPDVHGMSGHQFMHLLCNQYGVKEVQFTGSFTEAGFNWFKRAYAEGAPITLEYGSYLDASYRPMNFVEDWAEKKPVYPL